MATANMETLSTDDQSQQTSVREMAQLFKLLSDETRLRILIHLLTKGELHVRALCELLEQSQPAVSHHLALLRGANLIESRRDGKHNFYRVIDKQVERLVGRIQQNAPELAGEIQTALKMSDPSSPD